MPTNKFNSLYFPFRLTIFYFIGLALWQLLFIWFNDVPHRFLPIINGALLNFSMICGAFLLGFIPYLLFLIFGHRFWLLLTKYLHLMIWIFVCIVEFSSVLIYKEWGSSLDSRAVSYLDHPQEAWASVKDFVPLLPVFLGLLILVSGLKRISVLFNDWQAVRSHYFQSIVFMVLIGPLAFLGLRGGWQKLPIVPSDAFYSSDMKNNFAATNKVWYFLYSISKSSKISTNYDEDMIDAYTKSYQAQRCIDSTFQSIWQDKNIVLIVMEGWSADMVSYLYSKESVTPYFDTLSSKSFKFYNTFSTGFRTDQGLMSMLSGIPSIQSVNMPNVIDKVSRFPSLAKNMQDLGRETSFIYGGDLNFSNLYNYLTTMGFDTIIKDKDFERTQNITAWGVPDHITVEKGVDIMSNHKSKFFSTMLLLSSHAPFEVPIPNVYSNQKGNDNQYRSSVMYSDMALGKFFELAKSKPWYKDAIFIITSDHGSTHSGWAGMEDHNRFRIPFVIYDPNDSLPFNNELGQIPFNHFDIPTTISVLTGGDVQPFVFGRNFTCPDINRKAYWNIDVATAVYGNDKHIYMLNGIVKDKKDESLLFLDMVKQWFNAL